MTAYDTEVLADSPLLYWPLSTDANDASGNGRHGTVTGSWNFGVASGVGTLGNGSTVGATNAKIQSSSITFAAGAITVECWADTTLVQAMLWSFGVSESTKGDCYVNNNFVRLNGNGADCSVAYPTTGKHHVVLTWTQGSSATHKIYIDGVLRSISGTPVPVALGSTVFRVSGWNFDANYNIPAGKYVSHYAVYAGELSAARILAHFRAATPVTTNGTPSDVLSLECWIEGDSANDLSGKARHTTIAGSAPPTQRTGATYAGKTVWSFVPNSLMNFPSGLMKDRAAGEMIAVFKLAADPPTTGDGALWKWGADGNVEHIPYSNGSLYDGFGSTARKDATVNPTQSMAASYVAYNVRSASGAWSQHLDGTQIYTTATNTVGWTTTPWIGGNTPFELVFVAVFSEVLSSGDRALVLNYVDSLRSPVLLADNFPGYATNVLPTAALPTSTPVAATGSWTTEPSEPLTLPVAKTGWASFIPQASATYQIDTIGSNFDTGLAVYSGAALGSLTLLASDNDSGGSSTSKVTLALTAGTTYHVQIGSGTGTASGNAKVNITPVSYDGALPPQPTVGTVDVDATGWLYKGRTSHAQDALAGG